MATAYTDIYDLFQITIKDWRLDALYISSPTDWATYLEQFLVLAVDEFIRCDQSLARNDVSDQFTETLTEKNQVMLGRLMVKFWLKKEVRDVRQMALHVQDRDFKTFAEANHMRAKEDALSRVTEEISQALVDYSYEHSIDWSAWLQGNFWTP